MPSGRQLFSLGIGLTVAVLLGGYLFSPADARALDEVEPDLYWHCPKCGLEMTCPAESETKESPCPRCIHQGIILEVRDRGRPKDTAGSGGGWLFVALLVLCAALGLAVLVLGRTQPGR